MDNNEFLLLLQAKLDEAKSKGNINSDIKTIQEKINHLKLQAEIDKKTLSNLAKQIKNVIGNKISIDIDTNINTDALKQFKKLSEQPKIDKIQTNLDNGEYAKKLITLQSSYEKLGLSSEEAASKTNEVATALDKLKAKNLDTLIQDETEFNNALKKSQNEAAILRADLDKIYNPGRQTKLSTAIQNWLNKNTRASKEAKDSLNAYYTELNNGRVSVSRLQYIETELKKIDAEQRGLGKLGKSLKDQLVQAKDSFVQWMSVSSLVMALVYQLKRIPEEVKEVNAAMVELRKVSDASTQSITDYFDEAADSAKRLGSSVSDMINATADWSRLGYSLPDAKKLAEVATLYKNVGDGIDISSANESLISTLRGFQLEADDALSIIDKFNEVANNFPIDSAGIGDALQRSAASFYAANTDLSKSIALITGTNSVVQDPDAVGTMWKTVSMRIRGATTELEEAGLETEGMVETTSDLRDLIKGMTGFDIMQDENTFKDIYEIVVGIGKEWKNLSDVEQASLLEKLAGKRQGNALSAALNNISMIKDAYKTAENSAGSALAEQEEYEKGIQYSLDRLSASFQEFSNHILESDLLKGIIDFGDGIINVIDNVTSKLGTLGTIGVGAGLFAGIKNVGRDKMYALFYLF